MGYDPTGHMPTWAKWVVGGLAIAGLVAATVLTCGVAGAGAAGVGAAMLTGGLVSGSINVIDQLHDTGTVDWTEVAISTLSGTAYGAVVGMTGGAAGAWSWGSFGGKLAVAGGTSLLNSWNQEKNFVEATTSLVSSLILSTAVQGTGHLVGKFTSLIPRDPQKLLTLGDVGSYLWGVPAIKTGVIKSVAGTFSAIWNDYS